MYDDPNPNTRNVRQKPVKTNADPTAVADEELGMLRDGTPITAFGRHLYRCRHYGWLVGTPSLRDEYDSCPSCDCGLAEATTRIGSLLAALRASRAEVERMRAEIARRV